MGQNVSLSHPGQSLEEEAIPGEGRAATTSTAHHYYQSTAANGLSTTHHLHPLYPAAESNITTNTNNNRRKQAAPKPPPTTDSSITQVKKKKIVGVKKKRPSKSGQLTRKPSSSSSAGGGGGGARLSGVGNDRGVINGRPFRLASDGKPDVNHIRTSHTEYKHISEVHKGGSAQDQKASDEPLSSTELKRHRTVSGTTNSSAGTNHVPPLITVTDHSEAESTDIDFDPSNFHNRSGDENRTSTPKARPQDMDVSVSKYVSEIVQQRRESPVGSSGKERRTSGTSNVSTESESNRKNSRHITKRHSAEIRLKKGLLSKNDPKTDTANKWKNIVSEFEEVYVDEAKQKAKEELQKKKEQRKVSKLTNLDQYENVRQVFNRSMPLPMQMAPPGARVEDIEAETASETSTYSWNLMTPMAKTSRHQSASQENISSNRAQLGIQSHSGQQGEMSKSAAASRSHHGSMSAINARDARGSREFSRSERAAASRSRSASRSGSRSQSATGFRSRSQERQMERSAAKQKQSKGQGRQGNVVEESYMKETKEIQQSKGGRGAGAGRGGAKMVKYQSKGQKGVKFRKVTDINEQAAILVDDVLRSALGLLYGGRRRSSSSSKMSSSHASSSHHSSNHSSKKSSQHIQQHVEHVIEKHIDHRKGSRTREKKDMRSASIRPVPYSGQYSKERTSYETHSLPPPSKKRGSAAGDFTGMYDMVIQPLGEEKTQKSEAEMEWYRRLKEGVQRPRGDDDSNSTTSIKICHNERLPDYQQIKVHTSEARHGVNPPTITRGTVTRVFHDLDQEGHIPPSVLLAQLQSMHQQQQPQSGDYSIDYSTNTWPLNNRPYPNPPIDAIGPISAPLSPSSSHYNTIPTALNTSTEMYSDHWGYYSDGAYPSGYPSGQQSILLGNIPGGYVDDRIYLTPQRGSPPGGSYTLTSITSAGRPLQQQQDQGSRVDLMIDTNQIMRSLPLRLPSYQQGTIYDGYRADDISQSLNLPAIEEREEHSGTYSNEPIIVADLLEKNEQQPNSGSFYSTDNNARVNMNKNQQLNFYVFNQQGQQPGVPKITYAAQDIQARVGTETQQISNFFFDEGEMKEMVSQAIQAYQPEDPKVPDQREYTLYHKQTQTRPTPEPKPKKPSSPKRFERKKEKIIKRYVPRREPSPERPQSPVVHRETHHYITKEREIEKLPPAPPPKAEYSVQTEMTGLEWEEEMDSLYKALNNAEQRAYEAERAMDEMQSSNAAMESVVREMHQVVEEQEKKPPREIVIVKEPEPKPETDSESEEEFYEWTEIEEKEQRLSMAIYEEIEFNLQRSQGGTKSNESGKSSELVPWIIPDKYEAIVDRRRQKVTQIKDIDKEGEKLFYQAGNVPAGLGKSKSKLALEFDDNDELEGGGVTEQRDMTLRREQNIKHPKSSSEININIERDGNNYEPDASERHYFSMEHKPRAPAGKRNYMSTFDHEMDRAKYAPVRAKGRTNYRSDQHIPAALKSLDDEIEDRSRYRTSMAKDLVGTRNPETGSKYMTTIYKDEKTQGGNKPKHSVNLIRDVLGISNGPAKVDNHNEHSEKYVTSMNRTPIESGSHSTTYITEKSSKPGSDAHNSKHHVTKYTRHVKGGGREANGRNMSTSEIHIDKLRGFEIPVGRSDGSNHYYTQTDIELEKPDYNQLSDEKTEKSSRFVSRFDPGNIFFTARSRSGSSDTLLEMAKEPVEGHPSHLLNDQDDSLPDTLPIVEAEHMKRKSFVTKSENQQLPPKVRSHLEEDDDGNLVRVTTTEQQMTKTVDYVSEPAEKRKVSRPKSSDEALVEESFVEVDLTTENIREMDDKDGGDSERTERSTKTINLQAYGPEVVSETSVAYKAIEYDDQEKSLGIGTDEQAFPEDKYLYDMKTATLQPMKIRDKKSGETLMQYSLGDTMVTEL